MHPSSPTETFPLKIRPMHSDEVDECLKLIHLSIRALSTKFYSADEIGKIVQLYEKPSSLFGTIFVAEYQSQIVGVASAHYYFGMVCNINAVFTHPEFIHHGIGRQLVQALEDDALAQNTKIMTVTSSLTAVGFYQSLGYEYKAETQINGGIACARLEKQMQPITLQEQVQVMVISMLVAIMVTVIILL